MPGLPCKHTLACNGLNIAADDIPPRHTKQYCSDPSRRWTGPTSELGTKVATELPEPTHQRVRPQQPTSDEESLDVSDRHFGDDHDGDDGTWADDSLGDDPDGGGAPAVLEAWMVAGAEAYARLAVDAKEATSMLGVVTAVVNRVQDVPDLLADFCRTLVCAWPPHLAAPPACASTRSTVLDFAGSAVMAAPVAGRGKALLEAVEAFNCRINLSVMPVNARIERHSRNVLPGRKKARRSRAGSGDDGGGGGSGSK